MSYLLLKDFLSFFDDSAKIHIIGFGYDEIRMVRSLKNNSCLDKAHVHRVFASKMNSYSITIILSNAITLSDETAAECHTKFISLKTNIKYLNDIIRISAEKIRIIIERSIVFEGNYIEFLSNIKRFENMPVKNIRRISVEPNDNMIEIVVEENR